MYETARDVLLLITLENREGKQLEFQEPREVKQLN